jgi:hypothetical protein
MASLLSGPPLALANLIASSTNFETLVGADSLPAALSAIYFQEADDTQVVGESNLANPLPRAIVTIEPGWTTWRTGPGNWDDAATLNLAFQAIPPQLNGLQPNTNQQEASWFLELIESILSDLRANVSSGGTTIGETFYPYLNVCRFTIVDGPLPCDRDDFGLYFWGVDFRVSTPD